MKNDNDFDFSGYATKNNLRCADGRTIMAGAFKEDDGLKVPLVWQHQHNDVGNVLGHAILENRADGVYAYGVFNNTPAGQTAKEAVKRLLRDGWLEVRQTGSHKQFVKDGKRITVPFHTGDLKPGVEKDIRSKAGWD